MTKALVKTEEPKKEVITPKAFSFVEFKKGMKSSDLPVIPAPYYVVAQEGTFCRMKSTLGVSVLRIDEMPKSLGEMGNKAGYFNWDAMPVPAEVCAQIVSFFRRIWAKHKAEAEVLLTARIEKENGFPVIKEWRVFVPTQKVSMGGVESVYEPKHIAKGFQVVGTMHSHCNFSAFHSGTDTNDASSFDGLHLTIGFVDRPEPQVTAMVAISGYFVDMDKTLEEVADFSNLDAATAPPWWDNYVVPTKDLNTKHRPKGMELFDKYPKTPTTTPTTGSQTTYGDGWGGGYGNRPPYGAYQSQGGSKVYCNHPQTCECETTGHNICCQSWADECKHVKSCTCEINTHKVCCAKTKEETKPLADLLKEENAKKESKGKKENKKDKSQEEEAFDDDFWEDLLETKIRDKLFDDLLSDDEIARLSEIPLDKADTAVRAMVFSKMAAAKEVLEYMGLDISFVVKNPNNKKGKDNKSGNRQN